MKREIIILVVGILILIAVNFPDIKKENSQITSHYSTSNGKLFNYTDEGLQRAIWNLNGTNGTIYGNKNKFYPSNNIGDYI